MTAARYFFKSIFVAFLFWPSLILSGLYCDWTKQDAHLLQHLNAGNVPNYTAVTTVMKNGLLLNFEQNVTFGLTTLPALQKEKFLDTSAELVQCCIIHITYVTVTVSANIMPLHCRCMIYKMFTMILSSKILNQAM